MRSSCSSASRRLDGGTEPGCCAVPALPAPACCSCPASAPCLLPGIPALPMPHTWLTRRACVIMRRRASSSSPARSTVSSASASRRRLRAGGASSAKQQGYVLTSPQWWTVWAGCSVHQKCTRLHCWAWQREPAPSVKHTAPCSPGEVRSTTSAPCIAERKLLLHDQFCAPQFKLPQAALGLCKAWRDCGTDDSPRTGNQGA